MNNFLRIISRATILRPSVLAPIKNTLTISNHQQRQLTRNLWYLSNRHEIGKLDSKLCSCGCMDIKETHSKVAAERELVEFLTEEILAERKAQKSKTIPTELDGFKAKLDGAEVTLTKEMDGETIKILFNINQSVDADTEPEIHPNSDKPELGELKSRPSFVVDIIRGNNTVRMYCSYLEPGQQEDGYNDSYGIDEICLFQGEYTEKTYTVSGEVLDSYLYDLILNYLEEKGISNEFAEKMSEFSTIYEHSAYIGLLEGLSKFVSGK